MTPPFDCVVEQGQGGGSTVGSTYLQAHLLQDTESPMPVWGPRLRSTMPKGVSSRRLASWALS